MTLATNPVPPTGCDTQLLPKPQLARLCSFQSLRSEPAKEVNRIARPTTTISRLYRLDPFPHQLHISDISYTFIGFYYGGGNMAHKSTADLRINNCLERSNKRKKPTLSKRKKKKEYTSSHLSPHPTLFFFPGEREIAHHMPVRSSHLAEVSVLEQIEQCEEEISIETLLRNYWRGCLATTVMPPLSTPPPSLRWRNAGSRKRQCLP